MPASATLDFLRLSLVPGVGAYLARRLIEAFGSVSAIWQQTDTAWQAVEGVGPKLVSALSAATSPTFEKDLRQLLDMCADSGIHILSQADEDWPQGLSACDDAPLVLFAKGNTATLTSDKILAMVGARRASAEGRLIARRWSAYASERGVAVVSGMAPGIDSAAHGGSLDADAPGIAVLGYGLLAGNAQQTKQIDALAEQGCVISEYTPHTVARAGFFPQRNRLIAGMAQALVVIEGGLKSGSLITARQALHYGREVFAVPGSILNGVHAGCHQLIRDGAMLVSDAEEILQALHWQQPKFTDKTYQPQSDTEAKILEMLARQVVHLDTLAEDCGLTVPALSTILLRLELQGVVEKLPGSRYTLS